MILFIVNFITFFIILRINRDRLQYIQSMKTQDIQTDKLSLISLITHLQDITLIKKLKEIQVKTDPAELPIPEWQKNIVRDRIKNSKPEDLIPWEEARKQLRFKSKS